MYTTRNFKTKKDLKEAVAKGQIIGVFNPGLGGEPPANGEVSVEGPQGKPHSWYARVTLTNGRITKVT